MTKKEFLARCGNAYDMGLVSKPIIGHIERLYDGKQRLKRIRQALKHSLWGSLIALWLFGLFLIYLINRG